MSIIYINSERENIQSTDTMQPCITFAFHGALNIFLIRFSFYRNVIISRNVGNIPYPSFIPGSVNLGNLGRIFNPYHQPVPYPRIPNIGVPSYRPPGASNLGNISRIINPYPQSVLYPRIPNIGVPSYRPPGVQVGRNFQPSIQFPNVIRPESYYTEWIRRTMGPITRFPNYPMNPIALQIPFPDYNPLPRVNVPSYPYPQVPTGQVPIERNPLLRYPYPQVPRQFNPIFYRRYPIGVALPGGTQVNNGGMKYYPGYTLFLDY